MNRKKTQCTQLITLFVISLLVSLALACSSHGARLAEAVQDGEYIRTEELLRSGANPDYRDDEDTPVIIHGVRSENAQILRLLIEAGANVRVRGPEGTSPLEIAAQRGNSAMVNMLLNTGAYSTEQSIRNAAALAEMWGHMELAQTIESSLHSAGAGETEETRENRLQDTLLEAIQDRTPALVEDTIALGAQVDYSGPNENTPLMVAASLGEIEIIEILLDAGAEIDAQDEYGETALMKAAKAGHADTVQVLLEGGAAIDMTDEFGMTALFHAVDQGRGMLVSILYEAGADATVKTEAGECLYSFAADSQDITELLLEFEVPFGEDCTQLFIEALAMENRLLITELLDSGFDPRSIISEHPEYPGWSPLMIAVKKNMVSLSGELIELGVDVNARTPRNRTALHIACIESNAEITELLLENGADIHVELDEGRFIGFTSLFFAALAGNTDILTTLEEHGASFQVETQGYTPLMAAIESGSQEAVDYFLSKGLDVNAVSQRMEWEGATPLMYAAREG
ncbi:MAG: ankyrin repeat domain-containing protein, partial [Spirochaetia bacterium]